MQKAILLFTVFLSTVLFSQIRFEKGYFIDNSDNKTECLIKDLGWKNNPTTFQYKLSETSEIMTENIKNVKLFEVDNQVKFLRATVKIDRSSSDVKDMSPTKEPQFIEEQVFLKQLVNGEANLYSYSDGGFIRYFLQMGNGQIDQLIYKPYEVEAQKVAYNEDYKVQLKNVLTCQGISNNTFDNLAYSEKSFTNLFLKHNNCANPDYVNVSNNTSKGKFNIAIRPRINFSSYTQNNFERPAASFEMDQKMTFGVGVEFEYLLPFNKNKWAVIVEPTYQSYKNEDTREINGTLTTKVDYSTIQLPVGIRHYMFLNDTSQLFVNAQYVMDVSSKFTYEVNNDGGKTYNYVDKKPSSNFALGVGYKYKSKFGAEFRYFTKKNVARDIYYDFIYNSFSFILSYNIF